MNQSESGRANIWPKVIAWVAQVRFKWNLLQFSLGRACFFLFSTSHPDETQSKALRYKWKAAKAESKNRFEGFDKFIEDRPIMVTKGDKDAWGASSTIAHSSSTKNGSWGATDRERTRSGVEVCFLSQWVTLKLLLLVSFPSFPVPSFFLFIIYFKISCRYRLLLKKRRTGAVFPNTSELQNEPWKALYLSISWNIYADPCPYSWGLLIGL